MDATTLCILLYVTFTNIIFPVTLKHYLRYLYETNYEKYKSIKINEDSIIVFHVIGFLTLIPYLIYFISEYIINLVFDYKLEKHKKKEEIKRINKEIIDYTEKSLICEDLERYERIIDKIGLLKKELDKLK